jgi:F-type H+-transporting ATPase subunit epsilon
MSSTFRLTIASVGETRFDGDAISATLPAQDGEVTILAKHEPLVATLRPGTITVRHESGDNKTFVVESGVLECAGSRAIVLL